MNIVKKTSGYAHFIVNTATVFLDFLTEKVYKCKTGCYNSGKQWQKVGKGGGFWGSLVNIDTTWILRADYLFLQKCAISADLWSM